MNWNVAVPLWKEIVFIVVPVLLLAIAGWLDAWRTGREASRREKQLEHERDDARSQRDKLNTENAKLAGYLDNADKRVVASEKANEHLHAQLADRNEALQEEKAKVKALQMQTVEIEEVKPAKRTTRKKAGQA